MESSPPKRRGWFLAVGVTLAVAAAGAGWVAARSTAADPTPADDSVDVGFLRDMSDHHDQAVQLALLQLASGESEVLRGFAVDTIASQRYEIGLMEARLRDWGVGRGTVPRQAMGWMGMSTPVNAMPGMATRDELTELAQLRGVDADRLFIRLMKAHHEGGIHMAENAMRHAETEVVRDLAENIAKVQRLEIRDLVLAEQRLL